MGTINNNTSALTLGGCALGWLHEQHGPERAQKIADEAIENAINQGVNIIDVAPSYGEAEVRLNPWIQKVRNQIFLAEKTMERTKKGAFDELNRSLERLGTSMFDLYQFHAVSTMEELEQIFGKNGAIEAFREAQETGLIKYIGITGHSDMRVIMKALDLFDDFSTILIPVYVAAMTNPHPTNDFRPLLQVAQERNIGITAIKAISRGRWSLAKKYGTWYQPLEDQKMIDEAVWYTLSQEGVSTYSLPCDLRLWPFVFDSVKRYHELEHPEQEAIIKRAKNSNYKPLFPE
ncbi:MAG: aldo/keto reductase [Candidatus Heimdallarchaeota archaeon]|nr:MAG: aldo/keto reductase [Candidatus Heimdallarchaeota archaeon]